VAVGVGLQNNGGPTFTHALLPGSPAIDAGFNQLHINSHLIGCFLHAAFKDVRYPKLLGDLC
jgi:hypothetical protein